MDFSRNMRDAVSGIWGASKDTISKIGILGMFGWKLGLVSRAWLLGFSFHIHHCYRTRKNRLVHLPGLLPLFQEYCSASSMCFVNEWITKLDVSWEERATSLCSWYKKLFLCAKHVVFGGFSVLLNSLSLSSRPPACSDAASLSTVICQILTY